MNVLIGMAKQMTVQISLGVLIPMGASCAPVVTSMRICLLILLVDLVVYVNVSMSLKVFNRGDSYFNQFEYNGIFSEIDFDSNIPRI